MIPGLKFKYRVLFFPFVFMSYKSYYYFGNHILNKYNLRKGEKHGNGDKKKYKIKGGERHFAPLWW